MGSGFADEAARFFGYYNLIFLGQAFVYTAGLSLAGCGIGFLGGFALALLRAERIVHSRLLRLAAALYVEVFRRVPFLVMLMCVFFAFQLSGMNVSMFVVAATTVALSASAFSAENIRAGFDSVHANQWDAAESMNMSGFAALRNVVLPQAWRVIIPPSMTYAVGLVKNTSIASQIGVIELTYAAKALNSRGFSAGLCFGTILILYFILCYSLNSFAAWLEVRLDARRSGRAARTRPSPAPAAMV